jgi:hypothetical protein
VRLVLSALIGLLWTLQAQSLELDSPDLLATAHIPRLNKTETPEKPSEPEAVVTAAVKPAPSTQVPAPTPVAPALPANPGPQVNSKISLESFTWGADSRYRIQLYFDGKGLQFRGDLRADSRTEFTKDRLTIAIRHFPQDFLILAVSVDNDMYAHVFLIEASGASKENPFRILNSNSIRAHKEAVMDEMEAMIAGFKKVSGFDVAQSMRKMAEYFAQNPNKKAKDLFDSVEKEEAFVKVLAKPKGSGSDNGIVTPGQALDLRPNVEDPQQQQRARMKAERERQQRAQRQQQDIVGYDVYGRPIYSRQQGQVDRRQYQTPNYRQGYPQQGYPQPQQPQQPPPGYYRQNPFF